MYSERRVMFADNPIGFVFFVLLVPLGIGALFLLTWYLTAYFQRLTISDGRVIFERGMLSKDRVDLAIPMIRAVRISQSLQQRIFEAGDVYITSSGSDPEIIARGMPHAKRIRALLNTTPTLQP